MNARVIVDDSKIVGQQEIERERISFDQRAIVSFVDCQNFRFAIGRVGA